MCCDVPPQEATMFGLGTMCSCPSVTHQGRPYVSLYPCFPSHMHTPSPSHHLSRLPDIQSWLRKRRWLTLVDLFMRWGSILAVGLSLRLASYSLFLLTAFVVFINITFRHPDRYAFPEDRNEVLYFAPNIPSTFILTLTGRK